MKNILSLDDAQDEDIAGSKAASLAAVSDTSRVPQGFVVTNEAFRNFLERNGLHQKILSILARTRIEDKNDLKDSSREIMDLFENVNISVNLKKELEEAYKNFVISSEAKKAGRKAMELIKAGRDNPPVVVRSSPKRNGNSSPSIYRTTLNIKGIDNLVKEVKEVWKSFYSPEAIYYREKRGYPHDVPLGVLVQKMIVPDKTFSYLEMDPCNPERSVLEGVYGFGNLMFEGEVSPDMYFFDRNGSLVDKRTNTREWMQEKNPSTGKIERQPSPSSKKNRPVLDRREADEFMSRIRKVASRFGSSVMIEACSRNGDIFVLDITTLKNRSPRDDGRSHDDIICEGLGVSPGKVSGEITRSERSSDSKVLLKNMASVFEILTRSPEAILSNSGGYSSHQAKIARELDIPFVVIDDSNGGSLSEDENVYIDAFQGLVFSEVTGGFESDGSNWEENRQEDNLMTQNIDSITATELMVLTDSEDFKPEPEEAEGCVVVLRDTGRSSMGFGMSRERDFSDKLSRYPQNKDLWLKPDGSSGGMEKLSEVLGSIGRNPGNINVLISAQDSKDLKKKIDSLNLSDGVGIGLVVDTPESLLSVDGIQYSSADFFLLDFEDLVNLFFGHENRATVFGSDIFWSSIEEFCDTCRDSGRKVAVSDISDKRFLRKLIENGVDAVLVRPEKIGQVKNTVARIEKKLLLERMR